MKKHTFFGLLIAVVVISLITNVSLAQKGRSEPTGASSASIPAISPWSVSWADNVTSANVGSYPSVVYSPTDGLPYISYYDATKGNLMLTSPVWVGGSNCGVAGNWWCRVVDGDGLEGRNDANVGTFSSSAFWQNPSTVHTEWKYGVAYHDMTNNAIKYAVYRVYDFSASWDIVTVRLSNVIGNIEGIYTSLKFSSNGTPWIAYYSQYALSDALFLAHPVTSAGNCGEGADAGLWQCDLIDAGNGMGQYASLGIGYNDALYIAYYNKGSGDLKWAVYDNPGLGNCGPGNSYDCATIDGAGADVGLFASLTAPESGTARTHIAYYDKTNGKLKFAHPSSGGNCAGGTWQCDNVDSIGVGLSQVGIAMALDKDGNPVIAYENALEDQAPAILNIARPASVYTMVGIGNCGDVPPGYLFQVWQCDTIDNAAYSYGNVTLAAYTSIAVSPDGLGTIAYLEEDSYNSRNSLKVAFQRFQTFIPLLQK